MLTLFSNVGIAIIRASLVTRSNYSCLDTSTTKSGGKEGQTFHVSSVCVTLSSPSSRILVGMGCHSHLFLRSSSTGSVSCLPTMSSHGFNTGSNEKLRILIADSDLIVTFSSIGNQLRWNRSEWLMSELSSIWILFHLSIPRVVSRGRMFYTNYHM